MVNISQIKNEPSDWNITLSSNGTPISYNLENISPKPDIQPVKVKFSAYNCSEIPVVDKCSLTLLDHKNNSFKVSFML